MTVQFDSRPFTLYWAQYIDHSHIFSTKITKFESQNCFKKYFREQLRQKTDTFNKKWPKFFLSKLTVTLENRKCELSRRSISFRVTFSIILFLEKSWTKQSLWENWNRFNHSDCRPKLSFRSLDENYDKNSFAPCPSSFSSDFWVVSKWHSIKSSKFENGSKMHSALFFIKNSNKMSCRSLVWFYRVYFDKKYSMLTGQFVS